MYDAVQIAGSLLILAAFVAALGGRVKQSSYAYLAGNTTGSAALTGTAVIGREWGFIFRGRVGLGVDRLDRQEGDRPICRGFPLAPERTHPWRTRVVEVPADSPPRAGGERSGSRRSRRTR